MTVQCRQTLIMSYITHIEAMKMSTLNEYNKLEQFNIFFFFPLIPFPSVPVHPNTFIHTIGLSLARYQSALSPHTIIIHVDTNQATGHYNQSAVLRLNMDTFRGAIIPAWSDKHQISGVTISTPYASSSNAFFWIQTERIRSRL